MEKRYQPVYADQFECLAGSCPDSCCADWEIVIDPKTEEKYRKMKGPIGDQLRKLMIVDEDGDTIFQNVDHHCPWWTEDGLCRLRQLTDHETTSLICRQHPLIVEEYETFTEQMLSLSCPESCSLILETPLQNTYPIIQQNADDEVLNLLVDGRNLIYASMDETLPAEENIRMLYENAAYVQKQINDVEMTDIGIPDYNRFSREIRPAAAWILSSESGLQITTDRWKRILLEARTSDHNDPVFLSDIEKNRLLAYFICRYYLKAVNDCDLIHHASLILLSLKAPEILAAQSGHDRIEIYRLFSREMDHNADNMNQLYEFLSTAGKNHQ